MIQHPALIAVMVADLAAVLVLATASVGAVRVLSGWEPGATTRQQLSLERVSEEVSSLARLALALHAVAGLVLIVVVNHVLPSIVPGAMCGVGALQAMPDGTLALAVRGLAVAALWVWAVTDALNRSAPLAPLATACARALLVAVPVAFVAAWQTSQALLSVDVQEPVSCCAAVYDLARAGSASDPGTAKAGTWHALGAGIGLVVLGAWAWASRRRPAVGWTVPWALLALGWVGLAGWVLVDVAGPYFYRVLGHRCPLCFFLPHHFGVGYVLYGSLVLVVAGALAAATGAVVGRRCTDVSVAGLALSRRGLVWATVGMVLFSVVASAPAFWWRLRFGVWISG